MFFPDADPPLEIGQLESHPVMAKLKSIEREQGWGPEMSNSAYCLNLRIIVWQGYN